jgi:pyrroloquinoline-quinone synthase
MSTTASVNRAPRVTAHADGILRALDILHNPYLTALADGSMSLECFRRSQEQFFFAVTFFPRPMAALVGRISDPKARLDILHNLVEEHGEFQEELFHHTTFQKFLSQIGSSAQDRAKRPIWPALRAFNRVLTASCVLDELEVGVGCMGIIEHAFAGISASIGRSVTGHGWVKTDELVHYALHEKIDERHAEEFFAVVEPSWDEPLRRHFIIQGLELGAYVFDRLYRDMLEGSRREVTGPRP